MNHRDHDVGCLIGFYQFLSDLAKVLSVHLQVWRSRLETLYLMFSQRVQRTEAHPSESTEAELSHPPSVHGCIGESESGASG
jgi:hypothetical protein